eukprot:701664-Karenia_brevis.AAC.1
MDHAGSFENLLAAALASGSQGVGSMGRLPWEEPGWLRDVMGTTDPGQGFLEAPSTMPPIPSRVTRVSPPDDDALGEMLLRKTKKAKVGSAQEGDEERRL